MGTGTEPEHWALMKIQGNVFHFVRLPGIIQLC